MTPQIDVRSCTFADWPAFIEALDAGFSSEMPQGVRDHLQQLIEPSRLLVATEGDAVVATASSIPFEMTVPGGELPTGGLSTVAVRPTHRRQGILRQIMRRHLDDSRARGEPLSVLWASEPTIYQRFGYGIGSFRARIEVVRGQSLPVRPVEAVGRTRMVTVDEALELLPDIYERARRSIPGSFRRSPFWWRERKLFDGEFARHGGSQMFRVVLEIDGRPEGFAMYRMHASWGQDGRRGSWVEAIEVLGTTPAAMRAIWDYLFGVDLAVSVRSRNLCHDHPLLFSVLDPRELQMRLTDGLWVRVVDVEAALTARTYGISDILTFELSDLFCPWNDGVWTLEAGTEGAQLRRATAPPDLRFTAAELSAMYLGGVACTSLWRAGRVEEMVPGSAHRADLLFRSDVPPWCLDDF